MAMRGRAARLGRELVVASFHLDVAEVRRLIDEGANVNFCMGEHPTNLFQDQWDLSYPIASPGWTPLLALANSGVYPDPDLATVNSTEARADAFRRQALVPQAAIADRDRRRMTIARMLVDAGADLNAADAVGATSLYTAVYQAIFHPGFEELALYLIERGANVNTKTGIYIDGPGDTTPLHYASDNPTLVNALIAKGANVHARTTDGETPLDWANQKHNNPSAALLRAAISREN
jgi:hypothetical protein